MSFFSEQPVGANPVRREWRRDRNGPELSRRHRLKRATAEAHASLDRSIERRGYFSSRAGFIRFLSVQHALHTAYDSALNRDMADEPEGVSVWQAESCTGLIEQDLCGLGAGGNTPVSSAIQFDLTGGLPALAGASYVIEGSLLGGRFIFMRYGERLGLTSAGGRFLTAGTAWPDRWAKFQTWLDQLSLTSSQEKSAEMSACRLFADLGRVFDTE